MYETDNDPLIAQMQKFIDQEMEKYYSQKAINYFNNPVNIGRMVNSDASAVMRGGCGDTMEIYLRIDREVIKEIQFFTDGCGVTLACGSAVTEMVKGKTIYETLKIAPYDLINDLGGLPKDGFHCAILSVVTLHLAVADYFLKTV